MNESTAGSATGSIGDARLRRLALVLELEKQARHAASAAELGFVIVNETHNLTPYRQAVLWVAEEAGGRVVAMSGLAAPDRNAPFVVWMEKLLSQQASVDDRKVRPLLRTVLAEELREGWSTWLPPQVLLVPLPGPAGSAVGILLLARDEVWSQGDSVLLGTLGDAYGHAWKGLCGTLSWVDRLLARRRRVLLVVGAALIVLVLMPVRHSALAPAEVVAVDPALVRSSVEGVIDQVLVRPNQMVEAGQPLLLLDDARIANRLEVTRKAQEVAAAELRQASQQALFDAQSKAALAILRGRLEQHAAEVAYYESLLERVTLRAPRAGVVIFDNAQDLVGRPIAVGERVMTVADPAQAEVEIQLPVADAIELEAGALVRLFLNIDAYRPLDAELVHISYQAMLNPAGGYSYRLVASLAGDQPPPRIGLKGSAKVYGKRTVLGLYILRRPLSALRQWVGL